MAFVRFTLFFLIFFIATRALAESYKDLCNGFMTEEKSFFFSELDLTDNELLLACGTDKTPGWSEVPTHQTEFFFKKFLRELGYYNPEFKKVEDGKILIIPGHRSRIKKIKITNEPTDFYDVSFVGVLNQPMNSENLDILEQWIMSRLNAIGYPCPKLDMQASYETEEVVVRIHPGTETKILAVNRETYKDLRKSALSRFDAFAMGQIYNGDLLLLTNRRLIASNIVDYAFFEDQCNDNPKSTTLEQKLSYSKSRQWIFAFGASTEEYPIVKTIWRHSKLDKNASQLKAELYLSSIRQNISADSRFYLFNDYPRFYLKPLLLAERVDERVFTSIRQEYSLGAGYTHDSSTHSYRIESLPTYNVEDTLSGATEGHTSFLSLNNSFGLTSHYFEFYNASPRYGHQVLIEWNTQKEGIGSNFSVDEFRLQGTYLINWENLDPPFLVFGLRWALASLITSEFDQLPLSRRLYLGGDKDIRGFPRKSINNDGQGYKTTAYLGSEARLVSILPYELQPFILLDYAKVSANETSLDALNLWAPGLGLRWQSPFGPLRGTAAYGFKDNDDATHSDIKEQWTFFLSFGQEF